MAFLYADRVQETSNTTGTGTLTLAGASTGYRTFSSAIGNTNTCHYCIVDNAGTAWEVGLGTVGAGTLARTTVLSSTNSNALVNFASTPLVVFCTIPASPVNGFTGDSGSGGKVGFVPAPGSGDGAAGKVLRADGTWGGPAASTVTGLATIATSGSASDLSAGTLPSARFPALTGDVTTSAGSVATTIANDAVTNAKAANMAQATIKGRASGAGTGDPTDLTGTQATAILDNFVGDSGSGGTKGLVPAPASGDATKFLKGDGTWSSPSGSGDMLKATYDAANVAEQLVGLTATQTLTNKTLTSPTINTDITIPNTGLKIYDTDATHKLSIVPGSNLTANRTLTLTTGDAARTITLNGDTTLSGTNSGDQTITLTGDVTGSGTGSFAATVANDAVTNAKLNNMAASTIKARKTASTGDPEDCTLSEVLDLIGSAAQGDILYRDSASWARLAAGTSGHFLKTQGAAANPVWAAASASASLARGYIDGLITSRSSTTAIGISAGTCRDSTNAADITCSSAITKTTSSFSAGTGNGGLDTGAIAANTWYAIFAIKKDSDGTFDGLISTSATAPTMPAGYTYYRRIGFAKTNGSSQWTAYFQTEDIFLWDVPVQDINVTNPGTTAVTRTLSVPTFKVFPLIHCDSTNVTTNFFVLITALDQTDTAASSSVYTYRCSNADGGSFVYGSADVTNIWTNTSGQIRSRQSASGASDTFRISTLGWRDLRGKNA